MNNRDRAYLIDNGAIYEFDKDFFFFVEKEDFGRNILNDDLKNDLRRFREEVSLPNRSPLKLVETRSEPF